MNPQDLEPLFDVTPKVLHLVGGYHDGKRVTLDQGQPWPPRWIMPGEPPPIITAVYQDPSPYELPARLAYDYTSSVNDRGERAYQYVGLQ